MNVTEAIIERRSIKAYDPHHKMTEEEIAKLMSLAMLSPTAFNIQNWRFVVVTDPYFASTNSSSQLESGTG